MICGKVTVEQNSGTQATRRDGVQKVARSEAYAICKQNTADDASASLLALR